MKAFYRKYERHITTLAFISGFIIDNITLQRIDRWFEHVVLIVYACLAAFFIVVYNAVDVERPRDSFFGKGILKIVRWFPVAIQFAFGALFSGSLVFYSRSASLSVSWPFLILLFAFMVGNELVHTRYGRLTFQVSGFFVAIFLYISFALPTLLHQMGIIIFIAGGLISLLVIYLLVRIIRKTSHNKSAGSRIAIVTSILFLYGSLNVFYFANLIPPLPLSLKEVGIYHSVERASSGNYVLRYEPASWYQFRLISPVFKVDDDGIAYAFSAIFAPTKLSTEIIHEWFYKNEATQGWKSAGTISFPITGGRDGGYRGYTSKTVFPAKWRVDVKTPQGALIGRTVFTVEADEKKVVLETILR